VAQLYPQALGSSGTSGVPFPLPTIVGPWGVNFAILYKDSVRTSQETHHVSASKPNLLMLFGETVTVYCENRTEHTNTLFGQNAEFWCVKAGGTYTNHQAFKGFKRLPRSRCPYVWLIAYSIHCNVGGCALNIWCCDEDNWHVRPTKCNENWQDLNAISRTHGLYSTDNMHRAARLSSFGNQSERAHCHSVSSAACEPTIYLSSRIALTFTAAEMKLHCTALSGIPYHKSWYF
jgi:hypothetical protein